MSHYANPAYWEERYKKNPEPFEWYNIYDGFKEQIA